MKQCTKCKETKVLNEFNKLTRHATGYNTVCKVCMKKYNNTYRSKHKDRINTAKKDKYANDVEYKAKIKAHHKKHYATGAKLKENMSEDRWDKLLKRVRKRRVELSKNPEYRKRMAKEHQEYIDKNGGYMKLYGNKQRENLTDSYVKSILTGKNIGLEYKDITPDMIALKRKVLLIKRNLTNYGKKN